MSISDLCSVNSSLYYVRKMDSSGNKKSVKTNFKPDSDIHITLQDQQKINRFAKLKANYDDAKAELKVKQNELKNLEDAGEELVLLDDDSLIPFQTGDVFMYFNLTDTNNAIDKSKSNTQRDIKMLDSKCDELNKAMADLKVQLYNKFGNHINLEADDD